MKIIFILYICVIFFSCKKDETLPPQSTNNSKIEAWITDAEFKKISIAGNRSVKDIIFNNGNAAYLDDLNGIYFSYDNGTNWENRLTLTGNTAQCFALQEDGEKLFIGGLSLGDYTFGAKFWVYDTPENGETVLDYSGEAKVANSGNLVNHDFIRASWNGDGSVYASFGRDLMRDGFFGNITPDGRVIFVNRTPSNTFVMGKNPTKHKNHCGGFYIANHSENTTLCVYEYIPSANTGILTPYYSIQKGSGNSWLPLQQYWKSDYVYHIGQDLTGLHAIYVSQSNRLFYNGQKEINHKNILGNFQCASVDNNNYVWVGTSSGLFKSLNPLF
jgi:hypothetical protein